MKIFSEGREHEACVWEEGARAEDGLRGAC